MLSFNDIISLYVSFLYIYFLYINSPTLSTLLEYIDNYSIWDISLYLFLDLTYINV